MISEGTRRFDLYDFFSVLIPGGAFVVGVLPFLPSTAPVVSTGALLILVVAGFVFGRGIHALGLLIEQPLDESVFLGVRGYGIAIRGNRIATNHRDYFASQLKSPGDVSEELADKFYDKAVEYASFDLPDDRSDLTTANYDSELETLYTLTRSYIHMDSRGRSRTFQAVLDFQRTMMITSLLLFAIYFAYGGLKMLDIVPGGIVGYNSYLYELEISGWLIVIGAIGILLSAYLTFEMIRSNYRRYFIQYLMSDFINLRIEEDST